MSRVTIMKPPLPALMALAAALVLTGGLAAAGNATDAVPPPPGGTAGTDPARPWVQGMERWMNYLRTTRPEEYERLSRLRTEDPEAFRAEMRERMQQVRTRTEPRDGGRSSTADAEAKPGEPKGDGDRPSHERNPRQGEWSDRKPGASPRDSAPGNHRDGMTHGRSPRLPADPATEKLVAELRALSERYKKAENADSRSAIEKEVREKLAEAHDRRERERAERIAQMEKEIVRMREDMEKRRENRDKLIGRKVGEVLGRAQPDL